MRRQLRDTLIILAFVLIAIAADRAGAQEQAAADADDSRAKAEAVLRELADFLGSQERYQCKIQTVVEIIASGMNNRMESVTSLQIDRPRRFAIRLESGFNGVTLVSNGKVMFTHLPMLQRYSKSEAPKDVEGALTGTSSQAMAMSGPMSGFIPVGGDAYFTMMMEGVSKSKYLGQVELDGVICNHCRFEQPEFSWELWSEAGDRPLPRKMAIDISEQVTEDNPMFKDAQMSFFTILKEWDLNPTFADSDFEFQPPEDAEEVDDLFGDFYTDSTGVEPHLMLSQRAPAFEVEDLEGMTVDLSDHFGEGVVILDFWATWCGPCVEALPRIAEVAKEYAPRGVKLFAVNVGEESEAIQAFLDSNELNLHVLLDPDGNISDSYLAEAIPQTVIVGPEGTVQVVHVGFSANLKEQLSAELDRLLAGEDLAKETLEMAEQTKELAAANDFGATLVWSHPGRWAGVVSDETTKHVFVTDPSGRLAILDSGGSEVSSASAGPGGKLRRANLIVGGDPELVTFGAWGNSIEAHTSKGDKLWTYAHGQGIDDVWPADLNGDGADEVIVGYNGSTGLHVLDQRGTLLWKYTRIGNVWHVTASDVDGDGEAEVVTTSATGQLHIFSPDGDKRADLDLSIYGNMVRTSPSRGAVPGHILVTGTGNSGEEMISVSLTGEVRFELVLPTTGTDHVDELMLAPNRPWAAVAMRGGLVHVVDTDEGSIIATISGQGQQSDVAWLNRDGSGPQLLIATGRALNAFDISSGQ